MMEQLGSSIMNIYCLDWRSVVLIGMRILEQGLELSTYRLHFRKLLLLPVWHSKGPAEQ